MSDVPTVESALAYADGYKAALDDCERTDVARLIEERDGLEGKLSFERALRQITERKFDDQAGYVVTLNDEISSLRSQVETMRCGLSEARADFLACAEVFDELDNPKGYNLAVGAAGQIERSFSSDERA